jgi:hypothetical protein
MNRQSAHRSYSLAEPSINRIFCADPVLDSTISGILGPLVCTYLPAPSTNELVANFESKTGLCRLFIDDGNGPMRPLETWLTPSAITTVSRMLASIDGQSLDPAAPFLNFTLDGARRGGGGGCN